MKKQIEIDKEIQELNKEMEHKKQEIRDEIVPGAYFYDVEKVEELKNNIKELEEKSKYLEAIPTIEKIEAEKEWLNKELEKINEELAIYEQGGVYFQTEEMLELEEKRKEIIEQINKKDEILTVLNEIENTEKQLEELHEEEKDYIGAYFIPEGLLNEIKEKEAKLDELNKKLDFYTQERIGKEFKRVEKTNEIQENKVQGDQEQGNQVQGDQEQGNQVQGDQEQGNQVQGDQGQGNKVQGDQEQGNKVQGDQEQGNQVQGDQGQGNKVQGDQGQGNRKQEEKNNINIEELENTKKLLQAQIEIAEEEGDMITREALERELREIEKKLETIKGVQKAEVYIDKKAEVYIDIGKTVAIRFGNTSLEIKQKDLQKIVGNLTKEDKEAYIKEILGKEYDISDEMLEKLDDAICYSIYLQSKNEKVSQEEKETLKEALKQYVKLEPSEELKITYDLDQLSSPTIPFIGKLFGQMTRGQKDKLNEKAMEGLDKGYAKTQGEYEPNIMKRILKKIPFVKNLPALRGTNPKALPEATNQKLNNENALKQQEVMNEENFKERYSVKGLGIQLGLNNNNQKEKEAVDILIDSSMNGKEEDSEGIEPGDD